MARQQLEVDAANEQPDRNRSIIDQPPCEFTSTIQSIACSVYSWILYLISLLGSQKSKLKPAKKLTPIRLRRPQIRSNYRYRPLKGFSEFRLLELKPGEKKDPLVCRLKHLDLSNYRRNQDSEGDHFRWPHSLGRSTPSYEAISYVWGPNAPSEPILCDNKILNITPSLNNALRRVRKPSDTVHVWADAICIDQSDLRERKMQVDLMRLIFSNAKMVSVYLGGEVDFPIEDYSVLKAMLQVGGGFNKVRNRSEHTRQPKNLLQSLLPRSQNQYAVRRQFSRDMISTPTEKRLPTKLGLRKLAPSASRVIAQFFDHPWFSRIWVVQEVAESKDARVLFGDLEIPWQHVVDLAKRILRGTEGQASVLQFSKTKGIQNTLFMNSNTSIASVDPIPVLLQSTRDFAASDPRDKVYAMLHRPLRKPRRYVNVQFLHSKHYLEFFAQGLSLLYLLSVCLDHSPNDIRFWYLILSLGTVFHHLQFYRRIRSIAFDYLQRLAEFAIKLDRVVFSYFPVADTMFNMLDINADYTLTAPSVYRMVATRLIQRTGKLNILSYVAHGAAIDTTYPSWVPRWDMPTGGVEVLTAFPNHKFQASSDMDHTLLISSKHADHLIVEGIRFSTISSVSDVINQTWFPISNRDQPALVNTRVLAVNDQDRRKDIATLTADRFTQVDRESTNFVPGKVQWNVAAAISACYCYGRRQFVMENGSIGIGPAAMQPGDVVCVLFGGCVPYILRSTDTDCLYRIVGESYVQGMMQGEVIKEWKAGNFTKQRFTLC